MSYGELMEKIKVTTSKPSDSSSQLTARLVAAVSEMDVRQVMTKAGSNLVSLRLVAAMGEGDDKKKAQQYIRKLEKLLDRAAGKIRDTFPAAAPDSSAGQMDAASEAQIAAEAQAMAAAETASADVGGGAAGFSAADSAGAASPAPEATGGEAAAAEVDISV